MRLSRIALAGALLFGLSCELQDEGELGMDQGLDPVALDDSLSYSSDEAEVFIDETEVFDELAADPLLDEEAMDLSSPKKWKCWCCYYEHGDKKECYSAKDKDKQDAKEKAEDKCEDDHEDDDGDCRPKGCEKVN